MGSSTALGKIYPILKTIAEPALFLLFKNMFSNAAKLLVGIQKSARNGDPALSVHAAFIFGQLDLLFAHNCQKIPTFPLPQSDVLPPQMQKKSITLLPKKRRPNSFNTPCARAYVNCKAAKPKLCTTSRKTLP